MIEISERVLSDSDKKNIFQGSSRHAIAMSGLDELIEPRNFLAMDGNNIAGALLLEIVWGALHIKHLYVSSDYRGQQVGTQLMERANTFAKANNCTFIYVETLCPQMLNFYQKNGFILEYTRTGFANGASLYALKKI